MRSAGPLEGSRPWSISFGCRVELDGFSQGLAHAETNASTSLDLDGFPRVGVASDAGLAVLHLERAESGDRDALVLTQALLDPNEDRVNETGRSQSGRAQFRGHVGNELALVQRGTRRL